jgi:VIT1/CCC1 family predicted Fe2+/Mn2+ transporter
VRIFSRIAIAIGIALLTVFVIAVITEGHAGAGAAVVAFIAIAALVGAGNALYGRHSHGKKAVDRVRPAQEAANRAADLAAESRRAVAEAQRRGERYCPLDPAHRTDPSHRTDAADAAHATDPAHATDAHT